MRSGGRIPWRAPLYGNLEPCSLLDALIVSNPRVAKYPCRNRTILRSEKRVAGCEKAKFWADGRLLGSNPFAGVDGITVVKSPSLTVSAILFFQWLLNRSDIYCISELRSYCYVSSVAETTTRQISPDTHSAKLPCAAERANGKKRHPDSPLRH